MALKPHPSQRFLAQIDELAAELIPREPESTETSAPKAKPTSELRRRASRRNAQKSTGPRTAEGKARVSQNALKHGLFSQATLDLLAAPQRAEERAQYEELVAGLRASLQPSNELEELMVHRIADQYWRLNWLKTQRDLYLEPNDTKRYGTWYYVENAMPFTQEETRIENSILKLQRNLIFLQRYRKGEFQPKHNRAPQSEGTSPVPSPLAPPTEPAAPIPPAAESPSDSAPHANVAAPFAAKSATGAPPRPSSFPSFPMSDQTLASESGKQSQPLITVIEGIAKELAGTW